MCLVSWGATGPAVATTNIQIHGAVNEHDTSPQRVRRTKVIVLNMLNMLNVTYRRPCICGEHWVTLEAGFLGLLSVAL